MDWINQEFGGDHALYYARPSRSFHFCCANKTSSDTSQPVTTTTGASSPQATGTKSQVVGAGSIGVGSGGQYQESGAIDAGSNSKIDVLDGGAIPAITQIAQAVISNGSQTTSEAFQQLQDTLDQNSQIVAANNNLTNAALANNQDLAKNAATGGQSETNKTVLTIIGITAASALGIGYLLTRRTK
jgi:hypothetical protein